MVLPGKIKGSYNRATFKPYCFGSMSAPQNDSGSKLTESTHSGAESFDDIQISVSLGLSVCDKDSLV